MNTVRRARIRDAIAQINAAEEFVRRILAEEQSAYENLPDNIEHSAFSEASRYAVASLEEACEFLAGASGALEKVHV